MHLDTGQWDETLCQIFGVPMDALPEIVPTTGNLGQVTSRGQVVPITASVVDQQASLYGHGCRQAGDAKITFRHRRIRADGDWTRNIPVTGTGAFAHRCVAT